MTRFDFSPLFESTPSLDDHFRLLGSALDLSDAAAAYPPFNVEKRGEDRYRIVIAVAGFGPEDLEVEVRGNRLSVVGDKGQGDRYQPFLNRAVAGCAFDRTFHLADDVKVVGARLENGLLEIDLFRELPEEARPRRITIETSKPATIVRKAKALVKSLAKAA